MIYERIKKRLSEFYVDRLPDMAKSISRRVYERMDYVMLDLKLANDALHRKYTGVSNGIILDNLEILRRSGKPFVIRTPMIPGVTDTEENLSALARIVGDDPWERLTYNPMTPVKYARLGLGYPLSELF